MKTNSEAKWEPQITNNAINWLESDREQVAKILQENITFSGQLGDYVIHGAIEKLLEWRKLYSDQQNKELREKIGRLNAELMDDDPAHTMNEVTTQADIADEIEPSATQRSADDWKRMHDRVYQLAQKQESEIQRLTKELEKAMEAPNIDEEAHNYAASKIWIDKRDVEIQTPPVHEFHEYIASKSFKAGAECMLPQLTRLRELLGRAEHYVENEAWYDRDNPEHSNLLTEIKKETKQNK